MSGKVLEDTLRLNDDNVIEVHAGERGSGLAVRSLARSFGQGISLAVTEVSFANSAAETFLQGSKAECSNSHFPPCVCWILLQSLALNFSQLPSLSFQNGRSRHVRNRPGSSGRDLSRVSPEGRPTFHRRPSWALVRIRTCWKCIQVLPADCPIDRANCSWRCSHERISRNAVQCVRGWKLSHVQPIVNDWPLSVQR